MNAPPAGRRTIFLICSMLLLGFAATAWFAIQTKSPTYDEPYHALSSWLQWNRHDFRFDNEDPPLWQYWASLLNGHDALTADFDGSTWRDMPGRLINQWYWGVTTLYRTQGNDPVGFINRCRAMMLIVAVAAGGLIAYWSWKLGGGVAAVVATALFAFDPNFLAHSALMKNDVAFAFSLLLLAWTLWRAGLRLTIATVLMVAIACVFTLTIKFSGLIAVLVVPIALGVRALSREPWRIGSRTLVTRSHRLAGAVGVVGVCVVLSYLGIWAVYGFRFRPTPEQNVYLNMGELAEHGNMNHRAAEFDGHPPPGAFDSVPEVPTVTVVMFANRCGLFPQAYLAGFLFTYDAALIRSSYLCGELSVVGWWWYFPFAMLVKTPLATLLATMLSGAIALRSVFTRRSAKLTGKASTVRAGSSGTTARIDRAMAAITSIHAMQWAVTCLAIPFAVFLVSAIFSHLNIGIRHVLGLYPLAFVAIGWAVSSAWSVKKVRVSAGVFLLWVCLETFANYPNYIPYFNVVANHTSGGIELLGDSNLDWGQDLPLLKHWQDGHPGTRLYLSYFGYADPAFYHIRYVPLPGGYHYDPKPSFPSPYEKSVVAISATNLQGILVDPALLEFYAEWRRRKPIAVLGGSIYLYEINPGAPSGY